MHNEVGTCAEILPSILVRKLLDYYIPNHILCWIVDFLSDRRQRVKLAQDCFSEWRYIPDSSRCSTGDKAWAMAIFNND